MTHTAEPAKSGDSRVVLDSSDISRALTRLAHEIIERTQGAQNLTLMGIPTRGADLAARLATKISEIQGTTVPVGAIDVTISDHYVGKNVTTSNKESVRVHLVERDGIDEIAIEGGR